MNYSLVFIWTWSNQCSKANVIMWFISQMQFYLYQWSLVKKHKQKQKTMLLFPTFKIQEFYLIIILLTVYVACL